MIKIPTRQLLNARFGGSGLESTNHKGLGASFSYSWKTSLGIVQVGEKIWKQILSENDGSPKTSPGLSRDKGLTVLFRANEGQKERKDHSARNCMQTSEHFL